MTKVNVVYMAAFTLECNIMQKICGSYQTPPEALNVEHIQPPLQDLCARCTSLTPKERPSIHNVLMGLGNMTMPEEI